MESEKPVPPAILVPDSAAYEPVACLKHGRDSTVSLVRETAAGDRLQVARLLRLPRSPDAVQACRRTFERVQPLEHPRVQRCLQMVQTEAGVWFLSEFIPGYPADHARHALFRSKIFLISHRWVARWLQQFLEVLEYLHQASMVLGSAQPSDLVLSPSGAVLVDLQLAERTFPWGAREMTPFEAPERRLGGPPEIPHDVYLAGALGYWMLCGAAPQISPGAYGRLLPDLLVARPDVPRELCTALCDMLNPMPLQRPRSAAQAGDRFRPWMEEAPLPSPLEPRPDAPAPWLQPDRGPAGAAPSPLAAGSKTLRIQADVTKTGKIQGLTAFRAERVLTPDAARYRPQVVLKEGRFGTVLLVEEVESGKRLVARLLRLPAGMDAERATAASEAVARLLMPLEHPGMQAVRDLVAGDGGLWFLSDFVPGFPADHRPPAAEKVDSAWVTGWTLQLLNAVEYLHGRGVVLGRLAPADVVLTEAGPVIVDLGLWERCFPETALTLSMTRTDFVAPERRSSLQASAVNDIFLVGAVAWWLLTDRVAIVQPQATAAEVAAELLILRPDVPHDLGLALAEMLSYSPARRPESSRVASARLVLLPASASTFPPFQIDPERPVPWLGADAVVSRQPAPDRSDVTRTARIAQPAVGTSTGRIPRPEKSFPAEEVETPPPPRPVWLPAVEALDELTHPLFFGDIRRVAAAAVLGVLLVAGWLVVVGKRVGPAEPVPVSAPAVLDTGLMSVQAGEVQIKPRSQTASWSSQKSVQEAGSLVFSRSDHSVLGFGAANSLRLGPDALVRVGGLENGHLSLSGLQGRIWLRLEEDQAEVAIPGATITCPAGSIDELDLRADETHRYLVRSRRGTCHVQAASKTQADVSPGQTLALSATDATLQTLPDAADDAWDLWNLSLNGNP